tara:strand:- start:22835 stop:23449 length:615 start_codon:yes stop_codon:yes gene_type:complete
MSLLRDFYGFGHVEIISESRGGNGNMKVRGLFQEAEKANGNKRIYKKDTLAREVTRLQEMIAERRLVGELDHPSNEVVHLTNASHLITGLHMEGNQVIGEAEILNTPSGKVLQELLKAGVKIGISSRGTGTLTPIVGENHMQVGDNLKMITWDMVSDPSCQGAFPTLQESQLVSEQREHIVENLENLKAEKVFITALKKKLRKK